MKIDATVLYKLVCGMKSYIPGLGKPPQGGGATRLSRYCYSVWLRHLVMAHKSGLNTRPNIIVELGPGYSLGVGLCGLLSGAGRYYALDKTRYVKRETNLKVFDELVGLLRFNSRIPDDHEFPDMRPRLDSYDFPRHILTEERLGQALRDDRVRSIRSELLDLDTAGTGSRIIYHAPRRNYDDLAIEGADLIYTQSVMQEVGDLDSTYRALNRWLAPKGFMSHVINFWCYATAKEWNGH